MSGSENISILLLPSDDLGDLTLKQLHLWYELGIVSDAIILRQSELKIEEIERFNVTCTFLSGLEKEDSFGLFRFLGSRAFKNRDLVIPWLIMDKAPNLNLLELGYALKRQVEKTLPSGGNSGTARRDFYAVLLAVPSIDRPPFVENFPSKIQYDDFDLNIYVSPEIKATPEASSIPVISGWPDYASFVAAQVVSVAGLWSGNSNPLSSLVRSRSGGYFPIKQKVLVLRSMSSAVIARGLASKIIRNALTDVADQSRDPYADFADGRPISISLESVNEIDSATMACVERIINLDHELFNWTSKQKPKEKDFRRRAIETLKFFSRFVALCFSDFAYSAKAFFGNKFSGAVDKVFGETLEEYPERYFGINEELKKKFDEVEAIERNEESIDALAIAATAFNQKPSLWNDIRTIIFESLDTAVYKREELNTTPSIGVNGGEDDIAISGEKVRFLNLERKKSLNSQFGNTRDPNLVDREKSLANNVRGGSQRLTANSASRVLPHVNYVATNPAERFVLDPVIATKFGLSTEISFEESSALRAALNEKLIEANRAINSVTARILDLESQGKLQPILTEEALIDEPVEVEGVPLDQSIEWAHADEPSSQHSEHLDSIEQAPEETSAPKPAEEIDEVETTKENENLSIEDPIQLEEPGTSDAPQLQIESDALSERTAATPEDDLLAKLYFLEEK